MERKGTTESQAASFPQSLAHFQPRAPLDSGPGLEQTLRHKKQGALLDGAWHTDRMRRLGRWGLFSQGDGLNNPGSHTGGNTEEGLRWRLAFYFFTSCASGLCTFVKCKSISS